MPAGTRTMALAWGVSGCHGRLGRALNPPLQASLWDQLGAVWFFSGVARQAVDKHWVLGGLSRELLPIFNLQSDQGNIFSMQEAE